MVVVSPDAGVHGNLGLPSHDDDFAGDDSQQSRMMIIVVILTHPIGKVETLSKYFILPLLPLKLIFVSSSI